MLCPVTRAGEISLATRGGTERNLLPLFTLRNDRICSNFRAFPPRPSLALFVVYAVFTAVSTQLSWLRRSSHSSLTLTDAQKTSLVELEPAFEHLLRDVGLDESTIWALRHCRVNDRETFTGLADSLEELRTIASDLGINLTDGGMPQKREYSKVLMAWKRTKAQVEVITSIEALQRQHGEPVRMLPEDWTPSLNSSPSTGRIYKKRSSRRKHTLKNFKRSSQRG